MDDKKSVHHRSPNIEVVKHHKDSLPSWDELKYFIRKYYLFLLIIALIPVVLFSLGQQLANRGSAAPRLQLNSGGKVGVQGGGVSCSTQGIIDCNYNNSGDCMICNSSKIYDKCDNNAIGYCNDTDQCISGEISVQCSDRSCQSCQSFNVMYDSLNQKTVLKYSTCNSFDKSTDTYKNAIYTCNIPTSVPTAEVPTKTPAATEVPHVCNSSPPSAPVCNGAEYNTIKEGLICVPTGGGNCAAVYPTQPPPPQATNPPAQPTSAQQPTIVPGGTSCNPGEWGACGDHSCGGRQLPNCNQSGTGWNCIDAFAQC